MRRAIEHDRVNERRPEWNRDRVKPGRASAWGEATTKPIGNSSPRDASLRATSGRHVDRDVAGVEPDGHGEDGEDEEEGEAHGPHPESKPRATPTSRNIDRGARVHR